MYRYKKLMVSLTLDDHDANLIKYAGFVSNMADSDEIIFMYVSDHLDIPGEIKKIYPEILAPVNEAAEKRMRQIVNDHFTGSPNTRLTFKVAEGQRLAALIACSKDRDIDLAIVATHQEDDAGNNYLAEKLARKAFCSVLILPENVPARLKHVLVAVDFSENALDALDVGSAFAKAAGLEFINTVNTYWVPKGYYKTGKDYDEFAEIMLDNAKARSRKLYAGADLKGLGVKPFFLLNKNVAQGIQQFADNRDADLVVVGARGRSGEISAILLGSVTETLIRQMNKPLLAVKKKGEGLNILEALSSS